MRTIDNLDKLRYAKGEHSTAKIRSALQKTMQRHAAVFRRQDILEEGCKKVHEIS
jgi:succinate dehydrogenase (ubiquinone) flavoprotein subunit